MKDRLGDCDSRFGDAASLRQERGNITVCDCENGDGDEGDTDCFGEVLYGAKLCDVL